MSAFYESLFAEENPTEEAMEKEKHIDLSVIVPIYNTEAYLPVCLDSLLGIDGPCVEIVLVDDGSTDGSGKIADAYALEDSRIRVIHQANGGASVARNTGLEVARGSISYSWTVMTGCWAMRWHLCFARGWRARQML